MTTFLLTPSAISDLSLLLYVIFAIWQMSAILWRARKREGNPTTTRLLLVAFGGIAGFLLFSFLERILYPDAGQLALPLQTVFLTTGLVAWLQFAYHFPRCLPAEQKEARLVFWISLIYPLGELAFAVYRYSLLSQNIIQYRLGYLLAPLPVWIGFVMLRKVALMDRRPVSYWSKVWRPPDHEAQLTRDLAVLALSLVAIMGVSLLRDLLYITDDVGAALTSTGMLAALLFFTFLYLRSLPEQTSFITKLAAVFLASVLALTAVLAQMISAPFISYYRDPNTELEGKTLRFTPNAQGGYRVDWAPYRFDPVAGESLSEEYNHADIGFDFPFFGETWSDIYIKRNSYVAFGQETNLQNSLYQYGGAPSIFVLGLDLDSPAEGETGGLILQRAPGQATITWLNLPERSNPANRNTMQLRLYPDGVFEMSYSGLSPVSPPSIYRPWQSYRLIGALPGDGNTRLQFFQLTRDLPFDGGPQGSAQNYHLEFRRTLDALLRPYFYLAWFSAFLVLLGVPYFFKPILARPLENLLAGLRRADAGELDTVVPVQFNDEFGELTTSFNKMTAELDQLVRGLEARVAERTTELSDARANLDNILRSATDYAIITADRELHVTYFNPLAEEMYGISADDALGKPIAHICAQERDAARFEAGLRRVETNGAHEYVMKLDGSDGPRHIASRLSGVHDGAGNLLGYARFSRDVTERVAAEALLISQQRSIAALEERQGLARDLHDSVNQSIHSIVLFSGILASALGKGKTERARYIADRLQEGARQSLKETRLMLYQLRSASEQDMDLARDLDERLSLVERRAGIRAVLRVEGSPETLSPSMRKHLFWLAAEALNNALKYAQAKSVEVFLRCSPQKIEMEIVDDGIGFDAEEPRVGGIGLQTMHERAELMRGNLTINSHPGRGTRVLFSAERKGDHEQN